MTVCQATPSSAATCDTGRARRPTCSVAQPRPAGQRASRGGDRVIALRSRPQPAGHDQRRLRHTNLVGRPKHARSPSTATGRSFGAVLNPQVRHQSRSLVVSTSTAKPSGPCSTAKSRTSPSPTSSSHMRVASEVTGGSVAIDGGSATPKIAEPPAPNADPLPPATHAYTPLRREGPDFSSLAGPGRGVGVHRARLVRRGLPSWSRCRRCTRPQEVPTAC
jgi:hypothetical protein